jgi:predicted Zn-dependent protease
MRGFIIAFSSVFIFSACQSTDIKIGGVNVGHLVDKSIKALNINTIDEAQEIKIGLNISALLLGTRPLIDNVEVNTYVNKVGMWIASHSERPNLPWRFGVINSSSINAFSAPGGYIFITSAMIEQFQNEAQLAAVLAHEIAHVTEYHHLNSLKDDVIRDALTEGLFVSAQLYEQNTAAISEDEYGAWVRKVMSSGQELYTKGLDREDEFSADKVGIKLLAKAGYDVFSFIENLQLLASIAPDDTALALMYKTHPTPESRLGEIAEHLDDLPMTDGQLLTERFAQVMK